MSRPLPIHPRGPRRARRAPSDLLLACPRISPEWELKALRALMKPQMKEAIVHREAAQKWPTDAARRVKAACALVRERLQSDVKPHFPDHGDFYCAMKVAPEQMPHAMALAVVLSDALPGVWWVLGRLYVRDGAFFRRERGVKLNLVPATDVHLPRGVRERLRSCL